MHIHTDRQTDELHLAICVMDIMYTTPHTLKLINLSCQHLTQKICALPVRCLLMTCPTVAPTEWLYIGFNSSVHRGVYFIHCKFGERIPLM